MKEEKRLSLGEAVTQFLAHLSPTDREKAQPEVFKFVRWYGADRLFSEITIPEIANYAEQVAVSSPEPLKKLEPVKSFLSYARKGGLIKTNLAVHLRVRKVPSRFAPTSKQLPQTPVSLTRQGYTDLEAELIALRQERPRIAEELRRAAADKDFRENAPLEAAREYQGQIEARIRALESILNSATVMEEKKIGASKANVGDTVLLRDFASDEKVRYTLVSPSEANPMAGKISIVSPIGKAMVGREIGETVEVLTPAGVLRYQIEDIVQQ